jgi:tetratricopeptide (TPR) repeat protein
MNGTTLDPWPSEHLSAADPTVTLPGSEREVIHLAVGGILPPRTEARLEILDPEDQEDQEDQTARKFYLRAKLLLVQSRAREAILALEASVKRDPDSVQAYDAWLLLGQLRLGDPTRLDRALQPLQAATRLRPECAEPWVHLGELYLQKGMRPNARGCYGKAQGLDPAISIPVALRPPAPVPDERAFPTLWDRLRAWLAALLGA